MEKDNKIRFFSHMEWEKLTHQTKTKLHRQRTDSQLPEGKRWGGREKWVKGVHSV